MKDPHKVFTNLELFYGFNTLSSNVNSLVGTILDMHKNLKGLIAHGTKAHSSSINSQGVQFSLSDGGRDWLKPEQSRFETYVPRTET